MRRLFAVKRKMVDLSCVRYLDQQSASIIGMQKNKKGDPKSGSNGGLKGNNNDRNNLEFGMRDRFQRKRWS